MLDLDLQLDRPGFRLEVQVRLARHVTGIYGPSGSGKTTLLHLIAGLEAPTTGHVTLDGAGLTDTRKHIFVAPHHRRIGMVFQDGRLFPHYSVRGNLTYGLRLLRPHERKLTLDDVARLLALGELLDRPVNTLSGGQKQRVALGRALLTSPRLLLLDEPLASLDAGLKRQVIPFLRRVKETTGIPMLYVSHDISEILQLTDHVLVLDGGRCMGCGPLLEVLRDDRVFQLAAGLGLENVLAVTVKENLPENGLSQLESEVTILSSPWIAPARIFAPLAEARPGSRCYIAIRPEDIALARQCVSGISIQNQLAGRIVGITDHAGRVLVEVDVGAILLAEVTPKAVRELHLAKGEPVHCLFKARAVRFLG